MKHVNHIIFFLIMFVFFTQISAQYHINRYVFGNGSTASAGDEYSLSGTLGQSLTGIISNTSFQTKLGYWFTVDWIVSDITNQENFIPLKYELFQNYPNPFNPVTTIRYALPKPGDVVLNVYNLLGQHITTLINKQMPAGYHEVKFNASQYSTGFYIYRIETNGFIEIKKMIYLK